MSQPRIFLSPPDVTQAEEDGLIRAFRSGWIAPLGPEVQAFESELAEYSRRSYAVSLSSGTAALHLGLLALGVGPGDIVVTSSFTFAATTNAIIYTGAEPVLVDCDESGNMNPELLEETMRTLDAEGQKVKAIVPVDMLGKVADHDKIASIAQKYGAVVLSDAAESFGATRDGRPSASFGVASAISFNGNKIMTTSGGGALLTDDKELAEKVLYLSTQAKQPVPYYEHTDIGFNYRLSNLLAAVGRAQLKRLDEMVEIRRGHRLHYKELFHDVPGVAIFGEPSGAEGGDTHDNFWLTSITINEPEAGFSVEELRVFLETKGIEARRLWKPMHLQPVHQNRRAFIDGTSERLFNTGLSLPSGSAMSSADLDRVDKAIHEFLEMHS
ncbi:DegT/DnrJ/EryC1/StrS family aminotransferase [Corynebacterium sp. S7]